MTLIYELKFFVFAQQLCVVKKNVIISKNVVKVEFGLEDVFIGVSNRCTVRVDIVAPCDASENRKVELKVTISCTFYMLRPYRLVTFQAEGLSLFRWVDSSKPASSDKY